MGIFLQVAPGKQRSPNFLRNSWIMKSQQLLYILRKTTVLRTEFVAIAAEGNFMSKLFRCAFYTLLATAMIGPASVVCAQEEPIAVAAPVAKDAANDAPKADVSKLEATATATATEPQSSSDKRVRPLTVSVQLLRSDLVITGALTDSTLLALKTAFGEASIPLSEVAGVRFPSGQDTSTTLVMLNGDSITGASDVKSITVETEWGSAKVNGENISSMMFVPGLEWQAAKGLNGNRWTLTEAKAKPAGTSAAPGAPQNNNVPGMPPSLPPSTLSSPSNNTPRVVFPR